MFWILCYFLSSLYISAAHECEVRKPCSSIQDYYWRDYVGHVPPDAIRGGLDETASVTYIGQVLSPNTNGILPANIYPGIRDALATAGLKRFTHSKYVKILCSPEKDKFEWKKTHVESMLSSLYNYHLVIGGIEDNQNLYIGRAFFEGELLVGKVFANDYWARGLRLPMRNGTEHQILTYEVLAFPKGCIATRKEVASA